MISRSHVTWTAVRLTAVGEKEHMNQSVIVRCKRIANGYRDDSK